MPSTRPCRGAMTRSANGLSNSSVISLGALVIASIIAIERSVPPCGALDSASVAATMMIAPSTRPTPSTNSRTMSDLDLRELVHPEDAEPEHDAHRGEHEPAARVDEEHVDVAGA